MKKLYVITTHRLTDYDGLAAMVLARHLYPGAQIILPRQVTREVRDFLALYKDEFNFFEKPPAGGLHGVNLILVDTTVIPPYIIDPNMVTAYDHHPPYQLPPQWKGKIRKIGATTTLLLQEIQAEKIELTPQERTLAALGLYVDTVSFSSENTCEEDVKALLYLWRQGFNRELLIEFMGSSLNKQQEHALNYLLQQNRHWPLKGNDIYVFVCASQEYIAGLSRIATTLLDIKDADAVFLIKRSKDKHQIIGRSLTGRVPVGDVLRKMGGGGHASAASALVVGLDEKTVLKELYKNLEVSIKGELKALDIMSSPVNIVSPDRPISEVEALMDYFGHNGVVVEQDGEIKGIFSRRDLAKVKKHGLSHAPAKGFMSRRVITISPATALPEIQKLMVEHDIGRLPVVDENNVLVGIVTRTDLLTMHHARDRKVNRYGGQLVLAGRHHYNVCDRLAALPVPLQSELKAISKCADELGIDVYLVGGFVRDLLLGIKPGNIDLLIDNNLAAMVTGLQKHLGGELTFHKSYQTATLKKDDGTAIDLALARQEYYKLPGALPEVEPASIKQDLYRRDYTVNAMLISLHSERWGFLSDYFGGYQDINERKLRVLHTLSFIDDPRRIFRGVDLVLRYGFAFSTETIELVKNAAGQGVIRNIPGVILKEHLEQLLKKGTYRKLVEILSQLNLLDKIFPGLEKTAGWEKELAFLEANIKKEDLHPLSLLILILYYRHNSEGVLSHFKYWDLNKKARALLVRELPEWQEVARILKETKDCGEIFDIFKGRPKEFIFAQMAAAPAPARKNLFALWQRFKESGPLLTGSDLKAMGVSPGPLYQRILNELHKARFMCIIKDRRGEEKLAEKIALQGGGT